MGVPFLDPASVPEFLQDVGAWQSPSNGYLTFPFYHSMIIEDF
jgi:hypothetical protein